MSNIVEQRSFKIVLVFVDMCLIFIAYVLAFFIRYNGFPARNWESFLSLLPWILLIGLFFISVYELYSFARKSRWDIIRSILVAVTFMTFLTMSASFLFREFALPRTVIVMASVLIILFFIIWKITFMYFTRQHRAGSVLIIGDEEESQKLISQIKHPLFKGTKIRHVQPNTGLKRIMELIHRTDYIMLSSGIPKETKSRAIYHAMRNGKAVYVIPSLYELLLSRSNITSLDDTMVMAVQPFGLSSDQKVFKRVFDGVASAFLLLFISPLLLVVAALIKLEDPKGSIIYKQKRIGQHNREFTIYKFRSMIEGAENSTGPVLAEDNDPRITRVGHFLRMTRIDELPQLINVLKGDMSIVGPRPERQFFIKQLSKQLESYSYRSTVKPGITGYAQIMGKYSTDAEDKLRYDLYYIRNYSLWLDIIIILRTFIVLLDKTKAEGEHDPSAKSKKKSKNVTIEV